MTTPAPRYDSELQEFLDNHPEVERRSLLPEGIGPLREAFVSGGSAGLLAG